MTLAPAHADEAVDVLCDAFFTYAAFTYVLDPSHPEYGSQLRRMIDFFVWARFLKGDLVMGVTTEEGEIAGVATSTLPGSGEPPPELLQRRDELGQSLGEDAWRRYTSMGDAFADFDLDHPHFHLNLVGVKRAFAGRGLGRLLLDAVHEASARHETSIGVTLNTEDPHNVSLYERLGYEIIAHARLSEELETWLMFRPDGGL